MVALVSTASAWRCGVGGEEAGEEAAVAVAEDEGAARVASCGRKWVAAALEGGAEGEVFEPAIRAGDEVEVCRGGGWWAAFIGESGSSRMGVRRARSAAARRWVREMRVAVVVKDEQQCWRRGRRRRRWVWGRWVEEGEGGSARVMAIASGGKVASARRVVACGGCGVVVGRCSQA